MLLHFYHLDKNSTFGAEDVLLVHPWLETPKGYAYVLSAIVTDNPKSLDFWAKVSRNSPAERNIMLVELDELEIRVHGDTQFAAWTVPIKLTDTCTITPSCLLVKGYGKFKTTSYSIAIPSGYTLKIQGNYVKAFVTYLHPSSKYSGPGTDGIIGAAIMEFHPPENNPS